MSMPWIPISQVRPPTDILPVDLALSPVRPTALSVIWHKTEIYLAVHLPHTRQAVVEVIATLWADVNVVRVKDGPAGQHTHSVMLTRVPCLAKSHAIVNANARCLQ